ncbi:MAG: hypothetical protein QG561_1050 [Patescibacteria group bacterium]|nr:hypothetical protein [Patescibacteria group bacterium]
MPYHPVYQPVGVVRVPSSSPPLATSSTHVPVVGFAILTVTHEEVRLFPAASLAMARNVWEPFPVSIVLYEI